MVIASFKTVPEFFMNPFGMPKEWAVSNYSRACQDANLSITLPNTIIVTTVLVLVSTLLSAMVAYGTARARTSDEKRLDVLVMALPSQG